MHRLSWFLVFSLLLGWGLNAQSNPHGADFRIDCADCHNSGSWQVNFASIKFDHATTGFELEGQHAQVECRACHEDLEFRQVGTACVDCHTDVHQMSVGNDCARCHNSDSWLVFEIPELHEQNGFPLQGAHNTLACVDCHNNDNNLVWERIGQECVDCHREDYLQTSDPNHTASGFSTNCTECHEPFSIEWGGDNFHYFFPLVLGHGNLDCNQCHSGDTYQGLSPNCVSCHLSDYQNARDPEHQNAGFPTDCSMCHSLNPGWAPASFDNHDEEFFPIYSGTHRGAWNSCTDCHTSSNNFSSFSCIDCHEHNDQSRMAKKHDDVGGYRFESNACYNCHPDGRE